MTPGRAWPTYFDRALSFIVEAQRLSPSTTFLRRRTVEARSGKSRSTIYADIARGVFPAPVDIGPQSVAWIETEVEAVLQSIIRGASEDELRKLVGEMHEARGYVQSEAKRAKYKAIVAKRRSKAAQTDQAA